MNYPHIMSTSEQWWRGAVIYQIYPRSFLDTNGDGVGDLPGITAKLPYIASLGVDGVWVCPFYPSPMKDFGYDVSDFCNVDPLFGTLADFDALISESRAHKIKIIIDLVLSHTSDQHAWFQQSRQSKTNPKADWYVWADARPDGSPPNNWVSVFGGPAWTFEKTRGQYYLHNFLTSQPDLNYHNPDVQEAALDVFRFWLNRGVDGFRLDVVNFYFHDKELRDNPPRRAGTRFATQFEGDDPYSAQQHVYDKSQPEMLPFLSRMRAVTDEYGAFMVGELGDDFPYERAAEYTAGTSRLHTTYNPDLMAGRHKALTASLIRAPFETLAAQADPGWPSWAFSNHDVVRASSRWHPDPSGFRHDPRLSKMLITLLGCLKGTLFLYQGEELGLPEAKLQFEDLQDPWGKNLWPAWQGRDGCRTPMPWNDENHLGGFSKAKPWLPIPPAHTDLCAAAQERNDFSCLNHTRRFFDWRKAQPALIAGEIVFLDTEDEGLLAFQRSATEQKMLCVFNLTAAEKIYKPRASTLPAYGFLIEDL